MANKKLIKSGLDIIYEDILNEKSGTYIIQFNTALFDGILCKFMSIGAIGGAKGYINSGSPRAIYSSCIDKEVIYEYIKIKKDNNSFKSKGQRK